MRTRRHRTTSVKSNHFHVGGNKHVMEVLLELIENVVDFDQDNLDSHGMTDNLDIILQTSYNAPLKATVVSLVAKLAYPHWDTRKHQTQLGGLYSLRSLDTTVVSKHLYEIGWYKTNTPFALTRSFENKEPYTMQYSGSIKPLKSKNAFLSIVNSINVEFDRKLTVDMARYILNHLRKQHESGVLLTGTTMTISKHVSLKTVKDILSDIFKIGIGMSVTPSIVAHALCTIVQPYIWDDVNVRILKEHTANDKHSIGDVEVYNTDGSPFLAIEIKHNLDVTESIVSTFEGKTSNVILKYILTTKTIHSRSTDSNVYIGNVVEWTLFYLHSCLIYNNRIIDEFIILVRKNLLEYVNLKHENKVNIEEIFTRHLVEPSPE